jgi:hypothetical protein
MAFFAQRTTAKRSSPCATMRARSSDARNAGAGLIPSGGMSLKSSRLTVAPVTTKREMVPGEFAYVRTTEMEP